MLVVCPLCRCLSRATRRCIIYFFLWKIYYPPFDYIVAYCNAEKLVHPFVLNAHLLFFYMYVLHW
jgi:hypothetical protein